MVLWLERLVLAFIVGTVGFNAVTFVLAALFSKRQPRHLLLAFVRETIASLVLIPVWPLFMLLGAQQRARKEGVDPDPTDKRPPVILLHGYMMNRTNSLWFGPAVLRRGVGPCYGFTYWSFSWVETSAKRLAAYVEEVRRRENSERVDIVAHSLGGLVSRYFIEKLDGAARVRRLVTIATPHRGTAMALAGIGPVARELRPDSPVCKSFGAPPPGVHYTSVWSRSDNLILPPDSAQLTYLAPDAGDVEIEDMAGRSLEDVVFDDLGHLSLLASPRVADAVASHLSNDSVTPSVLA